MEQKGGGHAQSQLVSQVAGKLFFAADLQRPDERNTKIERPCIERGRKSGRQGESYHRLFTDFSPLA